MDEEKKAPEDPTDGMTKISIKKVLIVCLCILLAAALIVGTHPVWCSHDFDRTGKDEATCTESGKIKYKCNLCGQKKTEWTDPLGHDMKSGESETKTMDDSVYTQVNQVCERCGYTEKGEWKDEGTLTEYTAKMKVGLWLVESGAVLLDEYTKVSYRPEDDYYSVSGVFSNIFTKERGTIAARVELNEENEAHIFWAYCDGKEEIDEERIYGQHQ